MGVLIKETPYTGVESLLIDRLFHLRAVYVQLRAVLARLGGPNIHHFLHLNLDRCNDFIHDLSGLLLHYRDQVAVGNQSCWF